MPPNGANPHLHSNKNCTRTKLAKMLHFEHLNKDIKVRRNSTRRQERLATDNNIGDRPVTSTEYPNSYIFPLKTWAKLRTKRTRDGTGGVGTLFTSHPKIRHMSITKSEHCRYATLHKHTFKAHITGGFVVHMGEKQCFH